MALFQKKPDITSSAPLYTLGANKTVLVVGLGNPGKEYAQTRHNVGFELVDLFAEQKDFPGWIIKRDLRCRLTVLNMGSVRVILCKPDTFMNDSGEAVQAVQHFYKINNNNTLVAHDELAIPFGQLRTRIGGSDAGNNGIKSLISHIGDDFGRLRIGIGNELSEKINDTDFVLGKFSAQEQLKLKLIFNEASIILTEYIFGGTLPHETRNI